MSAVATLSPDDDCSLFTLFSDGLRDVEPVGPIRGTCAPVKCVHVKGSSNLINAAVCFLFIETTHAHAQRGPPEPLCRVSVFHLSIEKESDTVHVRRGSR